LRSAPDTAESYISNLLEFNFVVNHFSGKLVQYDIPEQEFWVEIHNSCLRAWVLNEEMVKHKKKKLPKTLLEMVAKEQRFSDKMIVYKGPTLIPGSKENVEEFECNLFTFLGVTTSGAGVIATVYPISPSSFANYLAIFANFDEWRLLAYEVEYIPCAKDAIAAATPLMNPITWAIDRDSSGAYTNYTGTGATFSTNNASCKTFSPNERSKLVYHMNGSDAAAWNTLAATAALYVKFYASGLSFAATYGYTYHKALFQLRGRT